MAEASDAEPPPRLRERRAEIAAIAALVDGVGRGAGASLAIDGAAGLGKSRLLACAVEEAGGHGVRVLSARGEQLERSFAFGVATQLFGAVVAHAEEQDPALLEGAAGLARGLRGRLPPAAENGGELFGMLHGLHWLTANLADRQPLLLVVDDLHWADAPSLRLLLYLLDRLEGMPVGVAAAIRQGEPCPPEIERLLDRLRSASGRVATLAPLSPEATAATVRDRVAGADDAFCRTVAELTAGNPLLVGALVGATGGDATRLPAATPAPVTRWVAERLAGLGPEAEAATDRDVRVEMLVELGRAEATAGLPGAGERLDEAIAITASARRRVEILAALAEARYVRSDYAGAVDAVALALAGLDGEDAVLEARLLAAAATAAALAPDRAAVAAELVGRPIARLLEQEPEHPTLPERVLLAYAAGGGAATLALDARRAVALARLALRGGDPFAELGRIVAEPLVAALVMADELDEALRLYTGMLDDARRRGALPAFANLLPMRAICWYRLGAVREALADVHDAVRLCAELPSENLALPAGHAIAAVALLDRGDARAAGDAVAVADAERRWGFLPVYGLFLMARGRVELSRGAPAEALASLRDGGARMSAAGFVNPASWDWRGDAALAAARLGDAVAPHDLAEEEVELARGFGAARALGSALRVLGLVEGGRAGTLLLEESVATLEGSPARLDRARALLDLGGALRRAGKRTEARLRLEEALDLAHRCGATALTERAVAELRTLGLRPRRPAVSGPDALTPSELRTATMAAAGMSNRAIAQELFLTVRTVESHLTAAYRKLAIASRGELPAALERRDA